MTRLGTLVVVTSKHQPRPALFRLSLLRRHQHGVTGPAQPAGQRAVAMHVPLVRETRRLGRPLGTPVVHILTPIRGIRRRGFVSAQDVPIQLTPVHRHVASVIAHLHRKWVTAQPGGRLEDERGATVLDDTGVKAQARRRDWAQRENCILVSASAAALRVHAASMPRHRRCVRDRVRARGYIARVRRVEEPRSTRARFTLRGFQGGLGENRGGLYVRTDSA